MTSHYLYASSVTSSLYNVPITTCANEGRMLDLLSLHGEPSTIRDITATAIRFIDRPRSEATWNDHIDDLTLRPIASRTLHVAAKNTRQAAIARNFIRGATTARILGCQRIPWVG
jgi:hypothetical protein